MFYPRDLSLGQAEFEIIRLEVPAVNSIGLVRVIFAILLGQVIRIATSSR